MTLYLSAEAVIAINAIHCDGTCNDRGGLDGALARPASGHSDGEFFVGLWRKAAAYLHALSRTQYFSDGNKRTAWLSTVTFLRLNGVDLPPVKPIEAEAFVRAVAGDLFANDGERDRTIDCAAEWFEEQATGLASIKPDPRVEYAFLASTASIETGGGLFEVSEGGLGAIIVRDFPVVVEIQLVLRVHWTEHDASLPARTFDLTMYETETGDSVYIDEFTIEGSHPPSDRWHHPNGYQPGLYYLMLTPTFEREAKHTIDVYLGEDRSFSLPLDVSQRVDVPQDAGTVYVQAAS